jgi:NitT/TauT family transport system permease protein
MAWVFASLKRASIFCSDKIMAGMVTIGMPDLAIELAINRLNKHLLRWHRGLEH